ncbi:MAG: hypothetical protein AB8G96_10920 [Phycisphaerales bacterium]
MTDPGDAPGGIPGAADSPGERSVRRWVKRIVVGGVFVVVVCVVGLALLWFNTAASPMDPRRLDLDRVLETATESAQEFAGRVAIEQLIVDESHTTVHFLVLGMGEESGAESGGLSGDLSSGRSRGTDRWTGVSVTARRMENGLLVTETTRHGKARQASDVRDQPPAAPGAFNPRLTFYVDRAQRSLVHASEIEGIGELTLRGLDFDRFAVPPTVRVRFDRADGTELSRTMGADGRVRRGD